MNKLKPYPEYKNSKISWIGKIPAHWVEMRAKYLFKEVDERSVTGDEEMLSVSHKTGVTPRSQKKVTMFKAESNVNSKVCHKGDLVVNTMWAWMSAMGISNQTGTVSPSYGVYRPIHITNYDQCYLDHLVRIDNYRTEYICRSTGIHSSRLRLYPDKFLSMPVLCPPYEEQVKISRYIAVQNYLITKYIRCKRSLVDLFSERIDTVTREAIAMKDTRKLRLEVIADLIERPIDRCRDNIYTPIGLFNRGRGIFHKEPTIGAELGESSFFWVDEGDLIFSGQFAWEGAVALAGKMDKGCIASHRFPIFRGNFDYAESAYLLAFFRTKIGHLLLDCHSRGAAGRNRPLNVRSLMKEIIPVPPKDI